MKAIGYPRNFVDVLAVPGNYNSARTRYYEPEWGLMRAELDRIYPGWISNHMRQCAELIVDGVRVDVAVSGTEYMPCAHLALEVRRPADAKCE